MAFTKLFAEVFRDFVTTGVPASGAQKPVKADVRAWGLEVESRLPATTPVGGAVLVDTFFKTGRPFADVRAWGAVGDGVTNDTTACQNAIDAVASTFGGGIVYFPPGNYSVTGGLVVSSGSIRLVGAGMNATTIQAWYTDVTVIKITSGANHYSSIESLTVFGKGLNQDTGTFGASTNAVEVACVSAILRDLYIWGGNSALYVPGNDCYIHNVYPAFSYGSALVQTSGGNWWHRCKIDHSPTGIAETTAQPYPARANSTAYTAGQVRILSGYAIQCIASGTSGGSAPTLKNYQIDIVDGTCRWWLLAKNDLSGMLMGGAAGENNISHCDFSGNGFIRSFSLTNTLTGANGPAISNFTQCIFSAPLDIQNGVWTRISGCEFGGNVAIAAGYTGKTSITDNYATASGVSISVGAAVSNFSIQNNILPSGTIVIAAGASDHYIVTGNIGCGNPTDGGTGTNKVVTGNVT